MTFLDKELTMETRVLPPPLNPAGLGGDGAPMVPAMKLALDANFGSVERWRDEFVACAKALGGSGWVLLTFQPREGTLVNQSADGPTHVAASSVPILALDVHDAMVDDIDWAGVYQRYQDAVHAASESIGADGDALRAAATVLDVRRAGVFEASTSMIAGARWRDPALVREWARELPANEPVVVYCIYGHEVCRSTAMRLRAAGVDARFLRGGIHGWTAAGGAVVGKDAGSAS